MDCSGYIQVLKRNGEKGSRYPMMERCVIGGALNCDIRMYVKGVANEHCVVSRDNAGRGVIENLTDQFPTSLNGSALKNGERGTLSHGDIFSILDRTFQWEYLQTSPFFGKTLSKNSNFSDRKVTGPLGALQHSASSPRRVAVVTPVRRGDLVQNKNGKQRKSIPASTFYRQSLQDHQAIKKNSVSRRSCTPHLIATVSVSEKGSDETLLDIKKTPSRIKGDQLSKALSQSGKRSSVGISKRKSLATESSSKKPRKSVVLINTKSRKSTNINTVGSPARATKLTNVSLRKSVAKKDSPKSNVNNALVTTPLKPASPMNMTKTPSSPVKTPSKSASPMKKTKTPSAPVKTPSKSASPVKKTKTPSAPVKTPSKSATPVKKTKTPSAPVKTPSKSASSVKKTKTPSAPVKTPSRSESPGKKAKTPVAQRKTPVKHSSKKGAFVSRLKTPVKRMLDTPSSEQQIAKRVKLDSSPVATKSKTSKQIKKPLFSEVVKKNEGKKVVSARKIVKPTQIKAFRNKIKKSSIIPRIAKLANSTGHAESPETIIIRKNINTPRGQKKNNQTPVKARKSVAKNTLAEFSVSELKKTLSLKSVSPGRKVKTSPKSVSPANKKMGRNSVISTPVAKKSPVGQKTITPASHIKNTPSPQSTQSSKEKVKSPVQGKESSDVKLTPLSVTPVTGRVSRGQKTPKGGKISKSPASPKGQKTPKSRKMSKSPASQKGQNTPKSEKISKSPASPKVGMSVNSRSSTRTGALKSLSLSVSVEDQEKGVSPGKKTPPSRTPSKTKVDVVKTPASNEVSAQRKDVTSPAKTSPLKKATPRDIIAAKNKRSSEGKSKVSVISTPVIKKSPKGKKTPQSSKVAKSSQSPGHGNLLSPRTPRQQTAALSPSASKNVNTPNVSNEGSSKVSSQQRNKVSKVEATPSPMSKRSTRGQSTLESVIAMSVSPRKSLQLTGNKSSPYSNKSVVKILTPQKNVHKTEQTPSPVKNIVFTRKSSGRKEKTILNVFVTSPSSSNLQPTPAKRKLDVTRESVSSTSKRSKRSSIGGSPGDIFNISDSFDLSSVQTPQIPQETFVSPLSMTKSSQKRKGLKRSFLGDRSLSLDLNDSNRALTPKSESSRRSTPRKTLNNSYVNMTTPKKVPLLADIAEIPDVPATTAFLKSPRSASRTSLKASPKKLDSPVTSTSAKSPAQQKSAKKSPTQLKASVRSNASPIARSPDKLKSPTRTPHRRSMSSPNVVSSKKTSTPRQAPRGKSSLTPNIKSKTPQVFETPKDITGTVVQNRSMHNVDSSESSHAKSPVKKVSSLKVQSSPKNDLRDVRGVKKLLSTPQVQASPKNDLRDVRGVKKILSTPKIQASPKNDLRDVRGVKKILSTPKIQASPNNDLRDVRGVKKLLSTPKVQASPKNDLRDVRGVKKLLSTPKVQASPKNDLRDVRGVKKLLSTPKVQASPKNDLRDVRGVKKLLSTPKVQASPRNDLSDVRGLKKLMRSPIKINSPRNDLTNVSGIKELFESPEKSLKMTKTDVSANRTTRTRGRNAVDKVLSTPKRTGKSNVLHSPVDTSTPAKRTRAGNQHTSSKSNVSVDNAVLTEKIDINVSDIKVSRTRTKHNTSSKTNVSVESITIAESGEMNVSEIKTTRTLRKRNITESSDNNESAAVSPPKSRRGTSKAIASSTPNLLPSDVESPLKGKRTRTKTTNMGPSKLQKSESDANISPSKSNNKNSPPKTKTVRGKAKTLETSVSSKASEGNESTAVTVSPVATRRGRPKSTIVETSKLKQSKSSKDEIHKVEMVGSPQHVPSPPKTRRTRTKTQEVASNIKESPVTKKTRSRAAVKYSPNKSSPIKSSPVKTRTRNTKKAGTSQNVSEQKIDTSHSEVNSALASPRKKPSRTKRSDAKTVTFTDNAPILLYEATSPIRPAKKGARETSKSKKVEVSEEPSPKQPAPTRTARARRATMAASTTVDASDAVTTRATRSRRK